MAKLVTGKVRLSFVNAFVPSGMAGAEPKYSVQILIPKTDKVTLDKIQKAIDEAISEGTKKWGGKVPPRLKMPLRDGDEEKPDVAAYKGMMFMSCSSKQKPNVVDAQVQPILDATELYSGCYGRVSINMYAFDVSGNRGIACGLNNIQKLADGESLAGKSRAEDDFTAVVGEDFLG